MTSTAIDEGVLSAIIRDGFKGKRGPRVCCPSDDYARGTFVAGPKRETCWSETVPEAEEDCSLSMRPFHDVR